MLNSSGRVKIITGGLIALFLVLSIFAHLEPYFPGDYQVTLVVQSFHSPLLLNAMEGISYVTSDWRAVLLVVAGSAFVWIRIGRLESSLMAISGLITLINKVLKIVVDRPRPVDGNIMVFAEETGKSFPSGHAFFAALALGMLAYLVVTHQRGRLLKTLTISIFLTAILWIGISRIYLGVHWASDVIGGYVIGTLLLLALIRLYQVLRLRTETKSR